MIKKVNLALLRFAYSKVDFIVISIIFILTNIPSTLWEVYLVGVNWSDEWKVRLASIIVDIIFATPYLWLRRLLYKKLSFQNMWWRHYTSDTLAILITYVTLKILKFIIFSKIGWVSMDGLSIAIWSIFIFAIFFGRITGIIIDRSHVYIQKKISKFLEDRIGYALLRFGAKHFFNSIFF